MPYQTLSDIKAMLAAHGLRPKHRFGQNFLIDHAKLAAIVEAAAIAPGDLALEVGPGTGTLSVAMLEAGASLLAVEVDRDLEPILADRFEPFGERAKLLIEDVLAGKHELNPKVWSMLGELAGGVAGVDPEGSGTGVPPVSKSASAPHAFKLIANLPYNVASPLLANLVLASAEPVHGLVMSHAVVMVQREVADRLIAGPGGKDYGQLGVLVQAAYETKRIMTLPPGCFWPSPKVDSAVVLMTRRDEPMTDDLPGLSTLLQRLFTQRRKQLGGILKADREAITLPEGVAWTQRPEQVSVAALCELAKKVRAASDEPRA